MSLCKERTAVATVKHKGTSNVFLWQHILAVAGNNTSKGTYNRNGFQLNLTMWLNMTKCDA